MIVTVRKTKIVGFRVRADGSVEDFVAVLDRHYTDISRATNAARRQLHDSLITVTDLEKLPLEKYYIDDENFYEVAERIK